MYKEKFAYLLILVITSQQLFAQYPPTAIPFSDGLTSPNKVSSRWPGVIWQKTRVITYIYAEVYSHDQTRPSVGITVNTPTTSQPGISQLDLISTEYFKDAATNLNKFVISRQVLIIVPAKTPNFFITDGPNSGGITKIFVSGFEY